MPGFLSENVHAGPDSVTMRGVSLKSCIGWAYHVLNYQVSGPDWLESQRYDIAAKSGAPAPEADLRLMMQALLADRFKLEAHTETKELSAYVLAPGKGGPKLHESQTDGPLGIEPDRSRMTVTVQNGRISQLAEMLANFVHAPVIDETDLKGAYDITVNLVKYLPQPGDGPPDFLSLIRTALQEELGLKLESRRTAVQLVVVDRMEKTPTEN